MQTIWFSPNLSDLVQGCLVQNFRVLASILTDIFNFLLEKRRKKESRLVSEGTRAFESLVHFYTRGFR